MTDYRWYNSDDVRDIEEDILDYKPKYISVCGCPLNHVILNWRRKDFDYIFTEACKTKVSFAYTLEEFMALNKKEFDSMKKYHFPFYAESGVRDLMIDSLTSKNVEICSCPLNHAYTFSDEKSSRSKPFFCKTEPSWSGPIQDILSGKTEPIKLKTELSANEVNLIDTIRKAYEKPPDKNIIAVVMMTQWIRAQRMPFESDRLLELYDEPRKKGIV